MTTRSDYIAMHALLDDHPKYAGLPSDGARYAFDVSLRKGKVQAQFGSGGRWASADHYRGSVGADRAKHLPALLSAGLLHRAPLDCERCIETFGDLPSGAIVVHDWREWQSDGHYDTGKPARDARYREAHRDELADKARKRRHGGGDGEAGTDAPDAGERPAQAVAGGLTAEPVYALIRWVEDHTGRPWHARPGQGAAEVLVQLVDSHGHEAVLGALITVRDQLAGKVHRPEQYVYPAQRLLEPITPVPTKRRGPALDAPGGQSYDDAVLH